jgi:hypothetical protein
MKKSFRELANRITGFEIPIFGGGVSWEPPTLDVTVAGKVITYLEDRRSLYNPYDAEVADFVVRSVLDIRENLTEYLKSLDRSSPLASSLVAMRAACRKFLDKVGTGANFGIYRAGRVWSEDEREFFVALGELRSVIGIHAAQIAVRYGIDVEETLVSIFPNSPEV